MSSEAKSWWVPGEKDMRFQVYRFHGANLELVELPQPHIIEELNKERESSAVPLPLPTIQPLEEETKAEPNQEQAGRVIIIDL